VITLSKTLRFFRREDGNIAFMTALAMMPLILAVGTGIDYSSAARRQFQIDAMADAAVLTAVTSSEMQQSCTAAQTLATNFFNNQVAAQSNIGTVSTVTVTGCPDTKDGVTGKITRTMTVSYTGTSANAFATAFGMPSIAIGGSATAVNSIAPNINFYLLLDTSPSMALAGTSAGITQMVALTSAQGGCAFACHQVCDSTISSACASDEAGNPYANGFSGKLEDNYALARANNIALRIDLVNSAVQDMFSLMQSTAVENGVTYQAAVYSFDLNFNTIVATPTSNFTTLANSVSTLSPFVSYTNNYYQTAAQVGTTTSTYYNDEATYLDTALQDMSSTSIMPLPGTGGSAAGQTPQEVLLIVTDGLNDYLYNGHRYYSPIDTGPISTTSANKSWCTTIKNEGIRIAVLYTTYWPTPGWYVSNVVTDSVSGLGGTTATAATALVNAATACASPNLFFQVDASSSSAVSTALQTLFQRIVATAYIDQ
jgi:Flp pilus assembly protein TadG